VKQEISGALSFPGGPAKSFNIMRDTGMLSHIFPEIDQLTPHQHAVLDNILHQAHSEGNTFALAALFSELAPKTVQAVALRLKVPNDEQKHIYDILGMQDRISAVSQHTTLDVLKKLMREQYFPDALKLYGMRVKAHDGAVSYHPFDLLTKMYAEMRQEDLHPEKFMTGNDLIALGLKPGKQFKDILDRIEIAQLRGEIHNKEQAIAMVHSLR
jgi:poly(A) polymerase